MSEDNDDTPTLSAETLAVLQGFLNEKKEREELDVATSVDTFGEDWQLSQFWYDDQTADTLVEEILEITGGVGNIACVSTPSIFRALKKRDLPVALRIYLFEYDNRFQIYKDQFIFYDFNKPTTVPDELKHNINMILFDPPFLSLDCITKYAITTKTLAQSPSTPVLIITGRTQEPHIARLLPDMHVTQFEPRHEGTLTNLFYCWINYDSKRLGTLKLDDANK
eukprot:TRINITY_DN2554_c0_g1_i2.p1 TRINITY_DN2554_c0_g1~~TRINITY_DN2554_c0_g1_i2.p1  ORF type:complete len:223 (+),score=55.81 TRINITY_DN2554_c0_g1_i2:1-669(+)